MKLVHAGHRFSFGGYKRTTVQRRILRRMGLRGITRRGRVRERARHRAEGSRCSVQGPADRGHRILSRPVAWETLDTEVIAPLVESKAAGEPIRAWVAGCATGEEAVLARDAHHRAARRTRASGVRSRSSRPIPMTMRSRSPASGAYPRESPPQLSADRLRRHFTEVADDHHYQVRKDLRESVVFGVHNLLGDPPYSKMDLVTCRNLLIYLEPEVQKKVVLLLHFALRPGGCLFLGSAETIGKHENLFEPVSHRWHIFRRIGTTTPRDLIELPASTGANARDRRGGAASGGAGGDRHGGARAAADRGSLCAGRGADRTASSRRCISAGRRTASWRNPKAGRREICSRWRVKACARACARQSAKPRRLKPPSWSAMRRSRRGDAFAPSS